MRHFIELSYKGTNYNGWQIQPNGITVQQLLNEAIAKIMRMPEVVSMGSGRTDTGVHALQQFAHIDLDFSKVPELTLSQLQYRLNSLLPADIAIHAIFPVPSTANARFDADFRTYHYFISTKKHALRQGLATPFYLPLNVEAMQTALEILLEYEDFESFALTGGNPGNHFRCTFKNALIQHKKDADLICIELKANRFLRGMVRSIVGTLLEVGTGKISLSHFRNIIEAKDRRQAGKLAPADGLYLSGVSYSVEYMPPQQENSLERLMI